MLASSPFDWQLSYFVLCRGALPLRDRRRNSVRALRAPFITGIPKITGRMLERKPGQAPFLAFPHRLPPHLRCDAHSRNSRHAAPYLHLRARPRLGHLELDRHASAHSFRPSPFWCSSANLIVSYLEGRQSRKRSLGRLDPRVVGQFAATRLQLRHHPDGREPPPAVGSASILKIRTAVMNNGVRAMSAITIPIPETPAAWKLPYRGKVAMACLIIAESAIFTIFVVAYLFYAGKSLSGPDSARSPRNADLLHHLPAVQQHHGPLRRKALERGKHGRIPGLVVAHIRSGRPLSLRHRPGMARLIYENGPDHLHKPLWNHLLLAGRPARFSRHGRACSCSASC